MPTDHNSSIRTGQPDSPWKIHKAYYLLVFAAVAVGIYLWGGKTPPGKDSAGPVESAATIYYEPVDEPGRPVDEGAAPQPADPERFERELASTENLQQAVRRLGCQVRALPGETPEATVSRTVERIGRGLQVRASETAAPGRVEIALSFRGRPADDPARLVNGLAEDFAERTRRDWKEQTRRAYEDAREASRAAELELTRAKARLDGFFDRHFEQLGSAGDRPAQPDAPPPPPPVESQPTTPIENPSWTELTGQLEELRRRRAELLVELTGLHPKVLQVDVEITAAERELQTVPREMPRQSTGPAVAGRPPAATTPSHPPSDTVAGEEQQRVELAQTFRDLKADADTAEEVYRRASQTERAAWQRHQRQPQIELVLADPTLVPASRKPPTGLLSVALAAGLAAAVGVGLLCGGAAMEPTLNTIDQVEAALAVPVIGTVAAVAPAADSEAFGPLQSIARTVLIFAGLLLIAGCVAAAVWAAR